MSTIRVLHVIARMNVGGTARYVGELVEQIPESALASGYVQGGEVEDPVIQKLELNRIVHLGRKISPVNDLKAWLELRRLIHEISPEIVHTHTFKAGLIGRLVGGKHRRVHTFHGHLFLDRSFSNFEKNLITFAERYLAKRTDVLISVGEKVGVELRAMGIGPRQKWISISPGVKPLPTIERMKAREILGVASESILVGWMGRMTSVKNPFLLLEVAKLLPETKFVMAGGGDLLEEVRSKAPTNVAVIGWADAATFWSAIDCAISTSYNEGMPIALIEAQLAGIPVVATDVGSISEVVLDGSSGIISHSDAASIAAHLIQLISNGEVFESMSKFARNSTSVRFKPQNMLSKHQRLYQDLLE